MSTTHCGTNIVRIRVDLFNDILRFDYVLQTFFFFLILKHIILYDLTIPIGVDWERERERKKKKRKINGKKEKKKKNRLGSVE